MHVMYPHETHALIQKGILNAGGALNIELQAKSVPSADLLRFYNLLGKYYLLSGDHSKGFGYLSYAYGFLEGKKDTKEYDELYLSVAANYIKILHLKNDHDRVLETASRMLEFQKLANALDRSHLAHFMIAMVKHKRGDKASAVEALKKSLLLCSVHEKTEDLKVFLEYDFVVELMECNELSIDLSELLGIG